VFAFSTVAATEENQGFLRSLPSLTSTYASCAVIFGHVLASWRTKLLGLHIQIAAARKSMGLHTYLHNSVSFILEI